VTGTGRFITVDWAGKAIVADAQLLSNEQYVALDAMTIQGDDVLLGVGALGSAFSRVTASSLLRVSASDPSIREEISIDGEFVSLVALPDREIMTLRWDGGVTLRSEAGAVVATNTSVTRPTLAQVVAP
jgi:hypothetical protein